MSEPTTWKSAVLEIVQTLPREFSLADVTRHKRALEQRFPSNRFVEAKIRQSLQVLRDQGILQFISPGHYQRMDVAPAFSPLIDLSAADTFSSATQGARVILETWASFNLYCLSCEADSLDRLADNTPVADFACVVCAARYQLKGKNGRFGPRITGAAYAPLAEAAAAGTVPEHILVEYDTRFGTVVFVDAIPGRLITPERIIPRKKLGPNARRAGWQGCNIDIKDLPYVRMVAPAGVDVSNTRNEWKALES